MLYQGICINNISNKSSERINLPLMSSNISQKYKYDILNVKGNPYYPIKNSIHKSRNGKLYSSNTEGKHDVVGRGLGIPMTKMI
mmetsp:Transcript_19360/g.17166  ORF Transcript_19360/g.17166 Transcript_19360/m.17166 type:complete len:84 (+) Transcript_19360:526-777(+)